MAEQNRKMLEETLFNLRYDMDCICDGGQYLRESIKSLTDDELEEAINEF